MTLQEYAQKHPFEYAEKAAEANETGKKLTMDKEVLILEDLPPLPPVPVLETTQE